MRGVCFPQQRNDGPFSGLWSRPFSEALSRLFSGPFSGTIRSDLVWTYGKPLSLISAAIEEIDIRPLQVHDSLLVGNVIVHEPQYHQDHHGFRARLRMLIWWLDSSSRLGKSC